VTWATAEQALVNPTFVRQDPEEALWFRAVVGRNALLTFPEDLGSVFVEKQAIILPPVFITAIYTEYTNSTAMADSACRVMEDVCPEVWVVNGFTSQGDCIRQMDSLPVATMNIHGYNTVDGNSTGCRHLHASLAVPAPEVHCPHLSYIPMEDQNGKVKCSESNDFRQEDFFSPSDINLFERAALDFTVNASAMFDRVLETDLAECMESIVETEALEAANIFPSDYFCETFLDSQGALGDQNTTYWMVLVSFGIVLQCLSPIIMRLRAVRV
jgi:hypothetical protein